MVPDGRAGHDSATAHRLLEAAAGEFARHGYAAARIRDIVDSAGVNLAAVNYHFGGKQGLYRATLAMLARRAQDDIPRETLQRRTAPPEERLRVLARVMLQRYLRPGDASPLSRIVAHELLDPTPAFGRMMGDVAAPQWSALREIVAELLGPRASEDDVALASLSIAGQWSFFLFGRRMFELQFPGVAGDPSLVDRLAAHIGAFSAQACGAKRLQLECVPPAATRAAPRGKKGSI